MKTTVSSKGEIMLPAALREQDGIETGQVFDVARLDRGRYRLKRRAARPNEGVLDWLLACPEKGYFVRIERRPPAPAEPPRRRRSAADRTRINTGKGSQS